MEIQGIIRRILLNDSGIKDRVGSRVWMSDLATMVNPILPCINFKVQPGTVDETLPERLMIPRVRFWCWSEEGYDESRDIANVLIGVLNQEIFHEDNKDLWFRQDSVPVDYFLEEPRYYATVVDFLCYVLDRS